MLSLLEQEALRDDLKETIRRLKKMRRNDLTPEQKAEVEQDIAAGKKRGQICKDRGYTYPQLQKALGFAWKKGQKQESAATPAQESVVEPETIN